MSEPVLEWSFDGKKEHHAPFTHGEWRCKAYAHRGNLRYYAELEAFRPDLEIREFFNPAGGFTSEEAKDTASQAITRFQHRLDAFIGEKPAPVFAHAWHPTGTVVPLMSVPVGLIQSLVSAFIEEEETADGSGDGFICLKDHILSEEEGVMFRQLRRELDFWERE